MNISKRYVNIREAEESLPKVRQSLSRLIEISSALDILKQVSIRYEDHYENIHKDIALNKKYFELNHLFFKELENLLHIGCVVKDLNAGLVDFFSKHKDKEIFLCWRVGEDQIRYWHEVSGSYAGRKPISML